MTEMHRKCFKMIKSYLKQIRKIVMPNQKEFYDWVLKNGKSFKENQISKIPENISNRQKQCYYNSQMLVLSNDKFDYYEGWYVTEEIGIPFEHSWNVSNGKVIDVTAFKRFNVREYFGIKIPIEYVRKMLLKTGYSDGFLGRYYYDEIKNAKL